MRRIRDIFNQGPYKSQFCVKLVDALLFQENGLANYEDQSFMIKIALWENISFSEKKKNFIPKKKNPNFMTNIIVKLMAPAFKNTPTSKHYIIREKLFPEV